LASDEIRVSQMGRREVRLTDLKAFTIEWRKYEKSWLTDALTLPIPPAPQKQLIELRAWRTDQTGPRPLHESYGQKNAIRRPNEVRSSSRAGDLYAWLVSQRRPSVVVEIGTAFGVSAMYWLAGLEAADLGHLYTFEINKDWAQFASDNMAATSSRFTLTLGAFEDSIDRVLNGKLIDIAFVDGIHAKTHMMRQFHIILGRASEGAIILFDDIDFPSGSMREGWTEVWHCPEVVAACEVDGRIGILQLRA
jgi:predicted O-methyltransferase YrrM